MTSFTPSLLFDATLLWFSTKYCKMAVTHQWRLSAPDVGYHLIYKCSTKCKLASKICFLMVTFHRANYKAIIFLQSIKIILGTKIKIKRCYVCIAVVKRPLLWSQCFLD